MVDEGEIVTLIGSNGAGKSTTLRSISGLTPASRGRIRFLGEDITARSTERIVAMGLCHCPEGRECWPTITFSTALIVANRRMF